MNILGMIKVLDDDIARCVKCGLCQSVCPVFLELGGESSVARGKIALVEALSEGRLKVTSALAKKIQCCLLCGTCVENCPSGVRVDYIVIQTRVIISKIKGLSFIKWVGLKVLLRNQRLFNLVTKAGSVLQRVLLKPADIGHARNLRLKTGLDSRRMVLPLARTQLRDRHPELISLQNPRGRVAFFTGCVANCVLTGIGDAVIEVLQEFGLEVIVPKEQFCCGIVAMASGDETTFRTLSRNNLKLFSGLDVDAIVVACATCSHTLKHQYLTLLHNEPKKFRDMARTVADRTFDICEYLVNVVGGKKLRYKEIQRSENPTIVTYHDPCHLRRGQGIYKAPRDFIDLIEGVRLKEMSMPDRCCGGGGSFNLSYYDTSLKILDKKIDDIERTDAKMVLTSCSGCHMHLVDGLAQRSLSTLVKHPVELYYEALKDGCTVRQKGD